VLCEVTVHVLDSLINSYQSMASLKNTETRKRALPRSGRFLEPVAASETAVFSGVSDKA